MEKEIVEKLNWQFDLTSEGEIAVCPICGRLRIDEKTGEILHPEQDKIISDILLNGCVSHFI
jgi:hypothetical protein